MIMTHSIRLACCLSWLWMLFTGGFAQSTKPVCLLWAIVILCPCLKVVPGQFVPGILEKVSPNEADGMTIHPQGGS